MPKVSVLLPTYNTPEDYLRENIESILGQSFTDFELIILDDASPNPRVREIIKSYQDPRIIFAENSSNLGISPSRNRLLDMAKGEYLAIADHDDISMPKRFQLQVQHLDAHPELGVVGSWIEVYPKGKIKKYPASNVEIEDMMMYTTGIIHPASMIRKSVLEKHAVRYEEEFSPGEDYTLFARLVGKTKFANIQEVLLRYRSHATNTNKLRSAEMDLGTVATRYFVRHDNPAIAMRAALRAKKKSTWKLFRFLPLMVVKERGDARKTYLLFGFIPLLSWKRRYSFFE